VRGREKGAGEGEKEGEEGGRESGGGDVCRKAEREAGRRRGRRKMQAAAWVCWLHVCVRARVRECVVGVGVHVGVRCLCMVCRYCVDSRLWACERGLEGVVAGGGGGGVD
jgi:hypothetical protein